MLVVEDDDEHNEEMGEEEKDGKEAKKWEGISEVILGKKEWFEAWMEGERACELPPTFETNWLLMFRAVATEQYMEIISAPDAWLIAEDSGEEEDESPIDRELKPTNSARRVKALVEQVTGMLSKHLISCSLVYRGSAV